MNRELHDKVKLGVDSLLRQASEKEYLKDLKEEIAEEFEMTKGEVGKIIKAAYDKAKLEEEIANKQSILDKLEEIGY
jgi:hypothetical protein